MEKKLLQEINRSRYMFGLKALTEEEAEKKINPEQMDMGKDVEKEHDPTYEKIKKHYEETGDFPKKEQVFEWIATDHLDEFKDYYTRLKKMEKEAEADKKDGETEKPEKESEEDEKD